MTDSMGVAFENRNFQKELDILTAKLEQEGVVPGLLLHSCCAPCSSYCIEYLSRFFEVTVFYYNPNISQTEEYQKRVREQIRFINEYNSKYPVSFIVIQIHKLLKRRTTAILTYPGTDYFI